MAYDDSNDQSASAALEDSGETGTDTQESSEGNFFLPGDFPGADALKAGDTITLRVVGKDADGDVEVENVSGDTDSGSDKPIMQDFEDSMK